MKISVVLFEREPGEWVAQCLQYDIGAQATNLRDLFYEFQKVLVGHILISLEHGQEPFECLPSAPSDYWNRLQQDRYATVSLPLLPFRMPGTAPQVEPDYVFT